MEEDYIDSLEQQLAKNRKMVEQRLNVVALQQELDKYKAKEKELRELVEENKYIYYTEDEAVEDCVIDGKYILQILNEGDK